MKLILIVLLLLLGAYFFPQVNEGVDSPCAATERRFAQAALDSKQGGSILGAMLLSDLSNGTIAREIMQSEHPNMPVSLACAMTYYQIMANPQMAQQAIGIR